MNDLLLRKAFAAEFRVLDETNRIGEFVISDETIDRYGDIIECAGWVLEFYRQNPVVPFAHNYRQVPVAKALDVKLEAGEGGKLRLVAVDQFADPKILPPDLAPVWDLYKEGYLRATSVGFIPEAWVFEVREDETGYRASGYRYTKQELLEHSMVPIPANPSALGKARAAGIVVPDALDWIEANVEGAEVKIGDRAFRLAGEPEVRPKAAEPKTTESKTKKNGTTILLSSDKVEHQIRTDDLTVSISASGQLAHSRDTAHMQAAHDALVKAGGVTCEAKAEEVKSEGDELDDIDLAELQTAVREGTNAGLALVMGRVRS